MTNIIEQERTREALKQAFIQYWTISHRLSIGDFEDEAEAKTMLAELNACDEQIVTCRAEFRRALEDITFPEDINSEIETMEHRVQMQVTGRLW